MFCFRCGQKMPSGVFKCPLCDAPQNRRQRARRRLFLGLVIFFSGAFIGSFVDSVFVDGPGLKPPGEGSAVERAVGKDVSVIVSTASTAQDGIEITEPPRTETEADDSLPSSPEAPGALPNNEVASLADTAQEQNPVEESPQDQAPPAVAVPTMRQGRLEYRSISVLDDGPGTNFHGSLSTDGKLLVFSSDRPVSDGERRYQCYLKEVGSQKPAFRLFPWPGNVWTPEFSNDGRLLVFSSDSEKEEHVFVHDRTVKQTKQLTKGATKNMMPAFSPNGSMIAFVSNSRGSNNIWIMDVEGKNPIQITTGKTDDREPRWSHDGRSIYFTRIRENLRVSDIMMVPLDPQGPPEVVVTGGRNWLCDPSPCGDYISWIRSERDRGSGNIIRLRRLSTKEEKVIEPFKGGEHFRPIWALHDDLIVFHASRGGKRDLFQAEFVRTP